MEIRQPFNHNIITQVPGMCLISYKDNRCVILRCFISRQRSFYTDKGQVGIMQQLMVGFTCYIYRMLLQCVMSGN